MLMPIPAWTTEGVIPPVDEKDPTSQRRAPYPVSLYDVVVKFGTTRARRSILEGFLNHRAALHAIGYQSGFQWLDGSFMENIEALELREPKDMDVVSFVHPPTHTVPTLEAVDALDHAATKLKYRVDHYVVELEALPLRELSWMSVYWYSMWAHRRTQSWKGFLQVELSPVEDAKAREWLVRNAGLGVHA